MWIHFYFVYEPAYYPQETKRQTLFVSPNKYLVLYESRSLFVDQAIPTNWYRWNSTNGILVYYGQHKNYRHVRMIRPSDKFQYAKASFYSFMIDVPRLTQHETAYEKRSTGWHSLVWTCYFLCFGALAVVSFFWWRLWTQLASGKRRYRNSFESWNTTSREERFNVSNAQLFWHFSM